MSRRQTKRKPKSRLHRPSLEDEIIEALADFADALERNEVLQRLTVRVKLKPNKYKLELGKTCQSFDLS